MVDGCSSIRSSNSGFNCVSYSCRYIWYFQRRLYTHDLGRGVCPAEPRFRFELLCCKEPKDPLGRMWCRSFNRLSGYSNGHWHDTYWILDGREKDPRHSAGSKTSGVSRPNLDNPRKVFQKVSGLNFLISPPHKAIVVDWWSALLKPFYVQAVSASVLPTKPGYFIMVTFFLQRQKRVALWNIKDMIHIFTDRPQTWFTLPHVVWENDTRAESPRWVNRVAKWCWPPLWS